MTRTNFSSILLIGRKPKGRDTMTFNDVKKKLATMRVMNNDARISYSDVLYDENKGIGFASLYIAITKEDMVMSIYISKWSDEKTYSLAFGFKERAKYALEKIDESWMTARTLSDSFNVMEAMIKAFTI